MKPNKRTTKIALLRGAKQVLRAKRRLDWIDWMINELQEGRDLK